MGYYDAESNDSSGDMKTKSLPCSSVSLGDFAILQGQPCRVIRKSKGSLFDRPVSIPWRQPFDKTIARGVLLGDKR